MSDEAKFDLPDIMAIMRTATLVKSKIISAEDLIISTSTTAAINQLAKEEKIDKEKIMAIADLINNLLCEDGEIKDLENSFAAVYSVALAMLPIVTHKHAEIEKLNRQENKN